MPYRFWGLLDSCLAAKELSQAAVALRERGINITEYYHLDDHGLHKAHLLALIQLTRLEQQRIGKSSRKLNRKEQEQARNYLGRLWFPDPLIRLLQERLVIKSDALLSVASKSEHYNRVNDVANAIRKAAGLPNVESAVQCLIDASKPTIKDRDDRQHQLLLRDLSDIKIKARDCASLADIEDSWFEATTGNTGAGVQLLTCHSAKGQEWDYVFVLNVVDGVFPRYQKTLRKREEEKRVFYVAATRHHKKLYLLQTTTPVQRICNGLVTPMTLDRLSSFIDLKKQGLNYINPTSKKRGKS